MNRKNFLALIPAVALLNPLKTDAKLPLVESARPKVPPYLVEGDTIGITCPAGYITAEEIEPSVIQMKSWGFNVVIGKTVGARDYTFGGTDQERLLDFQQMLDDPSIKAIMCARGGYGAVRIVDQLDFSGFRSSPKWIIGFSDITILHCHINSNYNVASIHSKMCNSFPSDWATAEPIQIDTINSIQQALKGEKMKYQAIYNASNRLGIAKGELIGGNLRCIENLAGSKSEIETARKILFLEDTGEALYSIDRMFFNLKRSGKLKKLNGLIIGGFKLKPDDGADGFGKTLVDIVMEKVAEYNYPVCFDFPVGHQRANFALKCGVKHALDIGVTGTMLTEL
ncbi:S66 peptidase family protein [Pedobacter insulae]|uniref:Muramoyltetrapeptide carboxypeptidase n=1 Tax=Pedobacter insulae TaxID=414048 RepID=A0A1I2YLW3_9SPHI|nr:LD-carboxypeptidase [Pedobacter insulae]SFH26540.1 muramoyltetrapeptide carboxypeptidase [Pedobacter insulae]